MKRGTAGHPKTIKLSRRLGISRPHALGIIEMLLEWAYTYAPRGDIGRHDNEMIAEAVMWDGDADQLIHAMTEAGWLDEDPEHRLVIHDLAHHADHTWKRKVNRDHPEGFACASTCAQSCANDRLPVPEPEPGPVPEPEPEPSHASAPPDGDGSGRVDPRAKAFVGMQRAVGRDISKSEDAKLQKFVEAMGSDPPVIHGEPTDPWELVRRAIAAATEHAQCQTVQCVLNYIRPVIERCIQHECWPGEFPRAGPTADEREAERESKAKQLARESY